MTEQEIQTNNEQIALFMGAIYSKHAEAWGFGNAKTHPIPIKIQNRIYKDAVWAERWEKELKYHSDWNWLMSAVNKYFETEADYSFHKEIEDALISFDSKNRIINVFNAVVNFIKSYNEKEIH